MPEKETVKRAQRDLEEGKAPSTAAGEFVREEVEHVRGGKHGARSPKQLIAIGLSKARRAGVPLKPPAKGKAKESTRRKAARDYEKGRTGRKPAAKRAKRSEGALRREPSQAASRASLSRHAKRKSPRRKKR